MYRRQDRHRYSEQKNMANRWTLLWPKQAMAAVLAMVLAACGGGGGDAVNAGSGADAVQGPDPAADYFPLAVGDRWTYLEAGVRGSARVTGTRAAGGTTVFVVGIEEPTDRWEEQYAKSSSGVFVVPAESADSLERAVAAVPILKLPIVIGENSVPLDRTLANYADFDRDGRQESVALRGEVTVLALETVTTPAGTWANAVHTRTVLRQTVTFSSNNQTAVVTSTSDDWFAPGVGLVRKVTLITGNDDTDSESNLLAWRVGTQRSESVAPTVISHAPLDAGFATTAAVRVSFSEAMDRAAGAPHGFTLRGPNEQAVAGNVVWVNDTTFDFVPAQTLISGRYVASMSPGAEDLAGNTLVAAQSWSFTIDGDGPKVLSSVPAANAVEVSLMGKLRLSFDEDLDPASVVPSSFTLNSRAFGAAPVPVSVAIEGRDVVLTPAQPLLRGAHYQLLVGTAISDLLGNRAQEHRLSFQADPGRFGAPRLPAGIGNDPMAMAIADFNADGRSDIAIIADGVGPAVGDAQLLLLLRAADGIFGTPTVVQAASDLACQPSDMQATDVDGDGRTDLVVSGGECGLLLLKQNTGGGFTKTVLHPGYAGLQAVLPIAADGGRVALVIQLLTGSEFKLAVLRQTSSGVFSPPQILPAAMNNSNGGAVADFDGDGRADLVFTGLLASNNGSGMAVLYQLADGTFGALREWRSDLSLPPTFGAAGDVTGDGRPDLVFSTSGNSPTYIGVVPQQADGSFGPAFTLATLDVPWQIRVADVTGDGRADVLVGHSGWSAVGVYEQGTAGLQAEQTFEAPYGCLGNNSLTTGDLDGDGRVDIGYCGSLLQQRVLPAADANSAPRRTLAQRLRSALRAAAVR